MGPNEISRNKNNHVSEGLYRNCGLAPELSYTIIDYHGHYPGRIVN